MHWSKRMKSLLHTLILVGSIAMPVSAQAEIITIKLYAIGIKAGTISINATENGQYYAVNGRVTPSALLKVIKEIGFTGSASGKVDNGIYQSKKYAGHLNTGNRQSIVKMHWKGRIPFVDNYQPERARRPYDIVPSKQIGTKDLLTAGYATFKSRSIDKLCNTTHDMFDGRRRSKITLGKPVVKGSIATCTGNYKRIAGFSPNDMQKRVNFPFTIHYVQQNDGTYRFNDFSADATFGKIRAIRK